MSEAPELSLNEAAIAVHEMFMSYQAAGFTAREALELVKAHIMAGMKK